MADRPAVHREVERKLRVTPDFVILDLVAHGVVSRVITGQPFQMTAVYHDTADLRLLRWGATLRRREGGPDAGWHLKLPVSGTGRGTRDELQLPLWAGHPGFVPAELADIVAPFARGERLITMAWVHTTRSPSILIDHEGVEVAELVDDHVEVRSQQGQTLAAFREIEIEARNTEGAPSPRSLKAVDRIAEVLIDHGAEPSDASKVAAALGARAGDPPDIAVGRPPNPHDSAREALRSIIALHSRHLVFADVAVRRGLPDSVHQLRVAARRLRSALRTMEPLLDAEWARTVEAELSWLASEVGLVRDTEVLADRLTVQAETLGEPDASVVRLITDAVLRARLDGAHGSALAALRSERHDMLLEDLVRGSQDPPVTPLASQPCGQVLPRLAERSWRRLERVTRHLEEADDGDSWHRVRIRAKRARYAVESIEPLMADRGGRLGRRLADVTDLLGGAQDARLAQEALREMAGQDGVDAAAAFALGRLCQQQAIVEQTARSDFNRLWPAVRQAAKHARWA